MWTVETVQKVAAVDPGAGSSLYKPGRTPVQTAANDRSRMTTVEEVINT